MAVLAERTMQEGLLSTFNTQEVANTASTYAELEMKNEALMAVLAERIMQDKSLDRTRSLHRTRPTQPGPMPHSTSRTRSLDSKGVNRKEWNHGTARRRMSHHQMSRRRSEDSSKNVAFIRNQEESSEIKTENIATSMRTSWRQRNHWNIKYHRIHLSKIILPPFRHSLLTKQGARGRETLDPARAKGKHVQNVQNAKCALGAPNPPPPPTNPPFPVNAKKPA